MVMRAKRWGLTASAVGLLVSGVVVAAPPVAGERIGNQAAATYDSGGQSFTVNSNEVTTVVNQIFGVLLDPDQSRITAPGNFVYFPHRITNNGNAGDTFAITSNVTSGAANLTGSVLVYADSDQDGLPDSTTPITLTPSIVAGADYHIVVRVQVASGAADGATAALDVTATSQGTGNPFSTVTDDLTVDLGGIIDITKLQTLADDADASGDISEGDTVRVQLSYANNGLTNALNISLEDVLTNINADGEAVTLTYINNGSFPTSWSDAAGALTEANDGFELTSGQGEQLDFQFNAATRRVTAALDTVVAGNAGEIIFHYVVTSAPEGRVDNIATVTSTAQPVPIPSNTSSYVIAATVDLALADSSASSSAGANVGDDTATNLDGVTVSTTDDGTAEDDIIEEDTNRYPGQTIQFETVLTNLSDVQESFLLSAANTAHTGAVVFPAGTVFSFVEADGSTPIVANTVVVPAGAVRVVRLVVTLPNGLAAAATTNFEAIVTATSLSDTSITNAAGMLFSGEILNGSVDVIDTTGGGTDGVGPNVDNGGAPWEALATDPAVPVTFSMSLTVPAGEPANSFDLSAFGNAAFSSGIPAGWTVEFLDGVTPITNSGTLTPTALVDAVFNYTVRVTPPAGAPASTTPEDIYVRALSPSNGASDAIYYTVNVDEVVDVSLTSNSSAQVSPGGVVTISHTLTNNGNSTITDGAITISEPFTGMSASVFYDANGNGSIDGGEVQISNINEIPTDLPAGTTARLILRVQVPGGITAGTNESGDISIATALTTTNGAATDSVPGNNVVTDAILVISGDLVLDKFQGLDADCNGIEDSSPLTQGDINADPGACIVYSIVAANSGTLDATAVIITDAVPGFTALEMSCGANCQPAYSVNSGAPVNVTGVADGFVGTLSTGAPGFTLTPGQTATLKFVVQLD